jgi:hypothetical protein
MTVQPLTWSLQIEQSGVRIYPPQLFQCVDLSGGDLPRSQLLLLSWGLH